MKYLTKNHSVFCIVLFALLSVGCRPMASNDESLELSLIKIVIEQESVAFSQRDYKEWASCYKQDEQTFWLHIENNQLLEARGWNELQQAVKKYMKENPKRREAHIARDNYHARITDSIAWVTFDEMQVEGTITRNLRGVRILEKVDEAHWKISYVNSYDAPM